METITLKNTDLRVSRACFHGKSSLRLQPNQAVKISIEIKGYIHAFGAASPSSFFFSFHVLWM